MSFEEKNKFDVFEVEVWEEEEEQEIPQSEIHHSEIHHNLNESHKDQQALQSRTTHQRRQRRVKRKKTKEKKYNWAFFLASLFIGLGVTATFDAPFGLFAGLGIGFLFFVDPIYEKVMQRLNDM